MIAGGDKITKAPKSQAGLRDLYFGEHLHDLLLQEYERYQTDKKSMVGISLTVTLSFVRRTAKDSALIP